MASNGNLKQQLEEEYGEHLLDFFLWSSNVEMLYFAEILVHILGLRSYGLNKASIGIIPLEFTSEFSQSTLSKWQQHPIVKGFIEFSSLFVNSDIAQKYPAIFFVNRDEALRKCRGYKGDSYLLALLGNSLARSPEYYERRQMLRLWLVVHSAIRLIEKNYHGDKLISRLARFLIKDSQNNDWEIIDRLLKRIETTQVGYGRSFDDYNDFISKAAESLISNAPSKGKERTFLNGITSVAKGECNPVDGNFRAIYSKKKGSFVSPQRVDLDDPDFVMEAESEQGGTLIQYSYLEVLDEVQSSEKEDESTPVIDDESQSLIVIDVDPNLNEAEQLLTSRSIFLQTAEQSSNLPWTWNHVLPPEQDRLRCWLKQKINSTSQHDALGACLVKLAQKTGRTLHHVIRFSITDDVGEEWAISEDFSRLHKRATRRQNSWKPVADSRSLVADYIDEVIVNLSCDLIAALKLPVTHISFKPETLNDLWRACQYGDKLEVWLNKSLPKEFNRLSSGKLSASLAQKIYDNTDDHNLARSFSAHPNSGLPGACGYANWDIKTIERGIEEPLQVGANVSSETYLLGSLLSPIEEVLESTINQANVTLEAKQYGLIEFHNLISQYTVYALYAATGSRYLKDPFESINHFNLELGFLFVNDKAGNELHLGRLVPLPKKAVQIVQNYVSHLEILAQAILSVNPALAENILEAVKCNSSKIPLFFLLDEQTNWHSMNKKFLPRVPLFEWGLPTNLFRHRYAQQMYKSGVPVEIIDGFMGHAERGAITYGDTSPRCWLDDVRTHTTELDLIFDALPFKVINTDTSKLLFSVPSLQVDKAENTILFGQLQREEQREIVLNRNIEEAKSDIQDFLGNRLLADITADEVQKLVTLMLFRNRQVGHHFAAIRLDILRDVINEQAPVHQSVIRKRIVQSNVTKSTLAETVAESYQRYEKLKQWRSGLNIGRNKYSKSVAALIGVAIFAIDKRVAYPRLLNDVLNGENFRLIQHKKQVFIEYSEALEVEAPYAPVQRHQVSQYIASMVDYGAGRKKLSTPTEHDDITALKDILSLKQGLSDAKVIHALAQCIEQVNHVDMPGMVGAALAGRVLSTSLPLQDHLRVLEEKTFLWPVSAPLNGSDDFKYFLKGLEVTQDLPELKENAVKFRKEIFNILNNYKSSRLSAVQIEGEVESVCKSYEGKVSSALLMVGYWIKYVISRGRKNRKSKLLKEKTILTYWSTLFTPFERLAYQTDIISLDGDEITDLYRDMIDYKILKADQSKYFGNRLIDFQSWARAYGVQEPDWSELNLEEEGRQVRAGILSEKDYQASLNYIRTAYKDSDTQILMSFLLLLTYRFGLRSSEASGLLARDWCQYQQLTWVLVRNNKFRKLKTESSLRPVPLLFELSTVEKKVIEQVLSRYSALSGSDDKNPIFCDVESGIIKQHSLISILPRAIINVVRVVTGSSNLVLHHARHTFHNRTAAALLEIDTPLTQALNEEVDVDEIQRVALGRNHSVSRRSSMALARLMGHSSPLTGMRSYNHLLLEWADKLTPVVSERIRLTKVTNTKDLQKYKASKISEAKIEYQPVTLETVFRVLRLVSIGKSYELIGQQFELQPEVIAQLKTTFNQANDKMRFNKRGDKSKVMGSEVPNALLRYINPDAWQRILSIAAAIPDEALKNLPALPSLQDLPNLVSRHRQVLIETEEHANLVKLVLELFSIDKENYSVCAKNDDPNMTAFLQEQGFEVTKVKYASYKATPIVPDVFEVYENGILTGTRTNYGVLNIFRNEGSVRSSNELAVVLLGAGSVLSMRMS